MHVLGIVRVGVFAPTDGVEILGGLAELLGAGEKLAKIRAAAAGRGTDHVAAIAGRREQPEADAQVPSPALGGSPDAPERSHAAMRPAQLPYGAHVLLKR